MHVANYPVGIDAKIQGMNLTSLLHEHPVTMLGIYGIGGIGKTTLAKSLFNKFKIANQYEGCCFLANVKEASNQFGGLVRLQQKLLSETLMDDIKVGDSSRGIIITRNRLRSKKCLIVLDDVDKREQLEALADMHDWFGIGSFIIVTARNKVQGLSHNEALELFSWHAFKKNHPPSDYFDLSKCAISYCKGHPSTLVLVGSFLGTKDISEWKSIFDAYENSFLDTDIQDVLQIRL